MKKVCITVLKCACHKELIERFCKKDIGPCPRFRPGQRFITTFREPKGFCGEAWKAIEHYVFALSCGAPRIFDDDGTWVSPEKTAIVSCNDGIRPVSFKVEQMDEEASPTAAEWYY
ncbi:TIGR04076 family protein [Mailhella massiliensis]|uniref:TIGR04076 family protein n=1 Tax=Mailhella massiliensis TaxID=1903261 RepID=UPI00097DC564|nr:TIGR04076 family protein [Mailhella massiliensis]